MAVVDEKTDYAIPSSKLGAWEAITKNKLVLSIIQNGLWLGVKWQNLKKERITSRTPTEEELNKDLVKTLADWTQQGMIEENQAKGVYHNFFPVVQKDKIRWCINARKLNEQLKSMPFSMETIKKIQEIGRKDDYMVSLDIQKAFNHIKINEGARNLTKFRILGKDYRFKSAPFGISIIPFIWTTLFGKAIKELRRRGIRISFYMDDVIILARSKEECASQANSAMDLFQQLGIRTNLEKSVLTPTKKIKHLGFIIDTKKNIIRLPHEKIITITNKAQSLLKNKQTTVKQLASLIGSITATTPACRAVWRRVAMQDCLNTGLKGRRLGLDRIAQQRGEGRAELLAFNESNQQEHGQAFRTEGGGVDPNYRRKSSRLGRDARPKRRRPGSRDFWKMDHRGIWLVC